MNHSFPPSTHARLLEATPILTRLTKPPRWRFVLFSAKSTFIAGLLLGLGIGVGYFFLSPPELAPQKESIAEQTKAGPRVHLPTQKAREKATPK